MIINISDHVTLNYEVDIDEIAFHDSSGKVIKKDILDGPDRKDEPIFIIKNINEKRLEVIETNPQDIKILTEGLKEIIIEHVYCKELSINIQKPVILRHCSCESINIKAFGYVGVQNVQCKHFQILSKDLEINDIQCENLSIQLPLDFEITFWRPHYHSKLNKIQLSNSIVKIISVKNIDKSKRNHIVDIKTSNMQINELNLTFKAMKVILDINEHIEHSKLNVDAFSIDMNDKFKDNFKILTIKDYIKLTFTSDEIKHLLRCYHEDKNRND